MKQQFKDKVAVITGSSSGIGLGLAEEFVRQGAKVVMSARGSERLENAAAQISAKGGDVAWLAGDVSREPDCKALIELAVERFGRIDILVCNAGISMRALFDDLDLSVLHSLMDTNFWGTVYCTKYALPYLQTSRGSVVGISSVAGIHGLPARTGYSASKYAMQGFLDTIRIENLKKGLHVMVVYPGFTASNIRFTALTANGSQQGETPRNEAGMMSPEEVARRTLKAIGRRKRRLFLDFNGRASNFLKQISPGLVDKLFYNHMAKEPDSPLK